MAKDNIKVIISVINSYVPAVYVHSMDFGWFWSYWEGHTSTVLVETLI